jgi:hypothetical protein
MLYSLATIFPLFLLVGVLAMERIERQFADQAVGERVVLALATDQADDLERLVSRASQAALDRHWRRRERRGRLTSAYRFSR